MCECVDEKWKCIDNQMDALLYEMIVMTDRLGCICGVERNANVHVANVHWYVSGRHRTAILIGNGYRVEEIIDVQIGTSRNPERYNENR